MAVTRHSTLGRSTIDISCLTYMTSPLTCLGPPSSRPHIGIPSNSRGDLVHPRNFHHHTIGIIRQHREAYGTPSKRFKVSSTKSFEAYTSAFHTWTIFWWLTEHDDLLRQLFEWLQEFGVVINSAKCKLGVSSVGFLVHHIDSSDVTPLR